MILISCIFVVLQVESPLIAVLSGKLIRLPYTQIKAYCIVLYCFVFYCIVLCCVVLCCVVLCCVVWYNCIIEMCSQELAFSATFTTKWLYCINRFSLEMNQDGAFL